MIEWFQPIEVLLSHKNEESSHFHLHFAGIYLPPSSGNFTWRQSIEGELKGKPARVVMQPLEKLQGLFSTFQRYFHFYISVFVAVEACDLNSNATADILCMCTILSCRCQDLKTYSCARNSLQPQLFSFPQAHAMCRAQSHNTSSKSRCNIKNATQSNSCNSCNSRNWETNQKVPGKNMMIDLCALRAILSKLIKSIIVAVLERVLCVSVILIRSFLRNKVSFSLQCEEFYSSWFVVKCFYKTPPLS